MHALLEWIGPGSRARAGREIVAENRAQCQVRAASRGAQRRDGRAHRVSGAQASRSVRISVDMDDVVGE
jgi:hypothetical protein